MGVSPRIRMGFAAFWVAVGIMLTTACGGGGQAQETDVKSLTIICASSTFVNGVKDKAAEYEKKTGIKINVENYTNEQLNDTLRVKLNARSSDFDMMVYQVQDVLREFVRNGWLLDMTKQVNSDSSWQWNDFQESARTAVTLDNKIYGVPAMTERQVVYYRKDLLAAKGIAVPKTMEELTAAARALHDPANGMYGIAMAGNVFRL